MIRMGYFAGEQATGEAEEGEKPCGRAESDRSAVRCVDSAGGKRERSVGRLKKKELVRGWWKAAWWNAECWRGRD